MKNEQTENKTQKDTKNQDWIFPRSVSLNFEESVFLKSGLISLTYFPIRDVNVVHW